MFKSIVLEGADGVGKTTLAKNLAKKITESDSPYEGYYIRFPGNGVRGFRDFFLDQKGGKATLKNDEVKWSHTYTSSVPPLVNLLHILGDFAYTFETLPLSSDVGSCLARGNTPVLVIDREIISTVVYQIMYAFADHRETLTEDCKLEAQSRLFSTIRNVFSLFNFGHSRDLLVHLSSETSVDNSKLNAFDRWDQKDLAKFYTDLIDAIAAGLLIGDDSAAGFLSINDIEWLCDRFPEIIRIKAFSQPSEVLAEEVCQTFLSTQNS